MIRSLSPLRAISCHLIFLRSLLHLHGVVGLSAEYSSMFQRAPELCVSASLLVLCLSCRREPSLSPQTRNSISSTQGLTDLSSLTSKLGTLEMLSQSSCISYLLGFPSGMDDHSLLSIDMKAAGSNTLFFCSDIYNWSMLLYLVWKQSSTLLL